MFYGLHDVKTGRSGKELHMRVDLRTHKLESVSLWGLNDRSPSGTNVTRVETIKIHFQRR